MKKQFGLLSFLILFPIFLFAQEDLPRGQELLTNNYFDEGLTNWELFSLDSTRAEYNLDTNSVITGKNCVHITVHNPYGDYPSGRINLSQHNIPGGIINGNYYYISFNLKVNRDIDQGFWTIYKEPSYLDYVTWDWIKASGGEVSHFSYQFQAKETNENVYFSIDLASFKNDNIELWIDDIHFIAVSDPIIEPRLPAGGIELLSNNYFDDGLNNWELIADNNDASVNLDTDDILESENSVHIKVNKTTADNPQQIRLYQKDLLDSVKAGSKYHIQFFAKANKSISNLFWTVSQQDDPQNILFTKSFSLDANEATFITDTIVSFSSNEKAAWSFDLGAISQDSVDIWFDAVHLMELGEVQETIFPPETTWNPSPPVTLEKPRYLQTVRDPQHGVVYTCISDPVAFGVPSGNTQLLSNYPKIQAWNADMSLISLSFGMFILDGKDYSIYKYFSSGLSERRWSNVDPKIAYFCTGNQFKKINIETEEITTLHTFEGYKTTIGPWEGNISADDKYVVITNESGSIAVEASLYDIELDSVISTKSFSSDIDWVTITPSGNYIVLNDRDIHETRVYDLDFNYLRTVGVSSEHGDFCVDAEGNEVWVQTIPLAMARLSDGKYTRLLEPNIEGHISGRGFRNPGWAFVSTGIDDNETQLFEIKLDSSGIIRHFGYARSSCTTYDNYPMGSVSPDGKRAIFNSDWDYGGSGGNAVAFVSEYKGPATAIEESQDLNISTRNFILSQNYPNPFNPKTVINFRIPAAGMTKLAVYNVLGQCVRVLVDENMPAGFYSMPFDGSGLSSGIYFYRLESAGNVKIKKMMLLK